ncbi:hypothetical protein C5N14_04840 [Micromonospora sp. MW-13]|uniref:hypothetical protein n=1 Tax=unclassified Micromonospora TaxID=2617518 RepID=UPI000E437795|nr:MULTISPECIES: hypothetical protein [unclassified Micromonospora]MCX4474171.1 hypothetical protein [Micromonospora sp. NBC_01655]RGC69732.1 hypothetical protein C5N14_04840 [Micromonospora sp. MW-13]
MDSTGLRRAYDEVLTEVDAGGFEPPGGRELSAEQIVAHLAANDELLGEATEAVLAGSPFAYYDLETVHRPQLDALVAEYGGLAGLATLLRATSQKLCALVDRLGPAAAQTPVDTRLHEDIDLRVDETLPWSRTLDLHTRVHLPKHLAQLRALRPELHAHRG